MRKIEYKGDFADLYMSSFAFLDIIKKDKRINDLTNRMNQMFDNSPPLDIDSLVTVKEQISETIDEIINNLTLSN